MSHLPSSVVGIPVLTDPLHFCVHVAAEGASSIPSALLQAFVTSQLMPQTGSSCFQVTRLPALTSEPRFT